MKEYIIIRQVSNGWIIQRECDGEDIERVETEVDELKDYIMTETIQTLSKRGQVSITIEHQI